MRAPHEARPRIKSKRAVSCRHEPTPGAQIFLSLLHFLITETLVSSCVSGEVTEFVSDFLSSCRTDSRFPVSDERFSLTACGSTYAGHITYAGRWFLLPLSLFGPSSPLAPLCTFPRLPLPGTFDFWPPLFVLHRV